MTTYHVLRANQGGHGTSPYVDPTGTTPTHRSTLTPANVRAIEQWTADNQRAHEQYRRESTWRNA